MYSFTNEAYSALYGNIGQEMMAGPRNKCMSQCTGCKCNCSVKHSDQLNRISEEEWGGI